MIKRRTKEKPESIEDWLKKQGAVEGIKYDEDTGQKIRVFTIDLTKEDRT